MRVKERKEVGGDIRDLGTKEGVPAAIRMIFKMKLPE